MPLNILRFHVRNHDVDLNRHPALGASADFLKVLRSFSMARKCDLKKCKRWFGTEDTSSIQQHLLQHSDTDRRAQGEIIKNIGYDPVTADIVCPICDQHFSRFPQFLLHLENHHLTTEAVYWFSFKGDITPDDKSITQYMWRGWHCMDGGSEECYCRHCGDYASSQTNTWIDHHLGFLSMADDIKAARACILRLIPAFEDHPIYEADMPTVHRIV
ncbi:hypothetical protein EJ04DRAFT_273291 [Polyplosphaeria fusca]|uniref:C2H2-type domain-containing protein n=1 Tax=Polyplosphaeria fusca TaxID=682080 RepID=A0A9P4QYC8_9PLEO|nr:hypothetical protein EJ04DRAFT_273291 [Polyplosphaeria fusca]